MSSWEIPTFRQFDREKRRQVAAQYGTTLVELAELYAPNHYLKDWEDRVIELFEAGASFSTRQWNGLSPWMQRRVLRTRRALRAPGNVEAWRAP